MQSFLFKTLVLTLVAAIHAAPQAQQRIVGGSLTTINNYPYLASLLYSADLVNYRQSCTGTILTTRSILATASCFYGDAVNRWRTRVGSTYANSGGVVHNTNSIIYHTSFSISTYDCDVALLRTVTTIVYVTNTVQPAAIAGANYNLSDNQVVWTAGWGVTAYGGAYSEQVRAVQIWTINQATCSQRYDELRLLVTNNMVCAGRLDVGNVGPCTGDNGAPLLHGNNNVVVGLYSWQQNCALARYPAVLTRISSVSQWITSNA